MDLIFENSVVNDQTKFYDLCCGSGTISLELISRGFNPKNIIMLDKSSWGLFWQKIGSGKFDIDRFNKYIDNIPEDRSAIQEYLLKLSRSSPYEDEAYKYILLQAGSFGGKQIWKEDGKWRNTSFRSYWQPTKTSKRRSPVNPMQPMPDTIKKRMEIIVEKCKGLTCWHIDVWSILPFIDYHSTNNSIFYLDPPYKETTQYGFSFDWEEFLGVLFLQTSAPIFVSECKRYSDIAYKLNFKGGKGGISGNKSRKNEEWLNCYP